MTKCLQLLLCLILSLNLIDSQIYSTLNSTYSKDITLTLSESPYRVSTYININEDVIFSVENGVEIVFTANYYIRCINCILNIGCGSTSNYIDTSIINTRGLASTTIYTYIHSELNNKMGYIRVEGIDAEATICNTKFEGLYYGIYYYYPVPLQLIQIDNSEFTNLQYAMYGYSGTYYRYHQFNDSYFHNIPSIINNYGEWEFRNCLFEDFNTFQAQYAFNIFDSTINGGNIATCISNYYSTGQIARNILTNCSRGIVTGYYDYNVKEEIMYNTFINNDIGIRFQGNYIVENVSYNNFIDNIINIEMAGSYDQPNLGYNYWGVNTTNQTAITVKINDECTGYSTALAVWWPYFLEPIDYNNLPILPTESSIIHLDCPNANNHPSVNSSRLKFLYTQDYTLTVVGSPYYIVHNVYIGEDVTFIIEDGVELIFMGYYDIEIRGILIIGCNDIDTSIYNNKGLASDIKYTYIHSNDGIRKGRFVMGTEYTASADFCNVKFDGLQYGIYANFYGDKNISFDNCEFNNTQYAQYLYYPTNVTFNDCYIHNVYYVSYGSAIYKNCKFEGYQYWGQYGLSAYNSEFIGDECLSFCVNTYNNGYANILINNTIRNCTDRGIYQSGQKDIIRYNTIMYNNIGIDIYAYNSRAVIEYNNFIDNTINARTGYYDAYLAYNYWGINIADQTQIALKIMDICDSYSNGLVTWWPYYTQPINNNLPAENTIAELICTGTNPYNISGTYNILNAVYVVDTILTVSSSPYYVVHNVYIRENITLYIENGVDIIFMGNYYIYVKGHINIGCSFINTDLYNNRGLVTNIPIYTHIRSDQLNRFGAIYLQYSNYNGRNVSIKACNVLFESLQYAVYDSSSSTASVYIDNCEFAGNYYGLYMSTSIETDHVVFDSKFHGHYYSLQGKVFADNIIISDFDEYGRTGYLYYATVRNSEFNGGGIGYECLSLGGSNNTVENNIFTNCTTAIYISTAFSSIRYNFIQKSNIGINIGSYDQEDIHFNNLIDNKINIQASGGLFSHNCSYNYYGLTNQTKIATTINDACNGYGTSLVTWWPYFSSFIYFNSGSLPTSNVITQLECDAVHNYKNLTGTVLSPAYFKNIILTSKGSPYYVVSNVFIPNGVTITIENDVEIIFLSNYYITIKGIMDAGCNDIRSHTDGTKTIGVYLYKYIHIYSDKKNRMGYINLRDGGSAYFCNVLFESLNYGIFDNSNLPHTLFIDNCEFKQNYYGLRLGSYNGTKYIQDSLFDGNYYAVREQYAEIDNCLIINSVYSAVSYAYYLNISNTQIIGKWSTDTLNTYRCVELTYYQSGYFINNTISNCYYGIYLRNYMNNNMSKVEIYGNNFINNWRTLEIYQTTTYKGELVINYNNFINNSESNIYSRSYIDQQLSFNYWGILNILNPDIISDTIYDFCDGNSYQGIIKFWPWLQSPFINMNNLPNINMYTIDAMDCNDIDTAISYIFTPLPTKSPTINPTILPTKVPTIIPTEIPTKSPTATPTQEGALEDTSTTTEIIEDTKKNEEKSSDGVSNGTSTMEWMIFGILLGLILCLCVIVFCLKFHKEKEKKRWQREKALLDSPVNRENNIELNNMMAFPDTLSTHHGVVKSVSSIEYDGISPITSVPVGGVLTVPPLKPQQIYSYDGADINKTVPIIPNPQLFAVNNGDVDTPYNAGDGNEVNTGNNSDSDRENSLFEQHQTTKGDNNGMDNDDNNDGIPALPGSLKPPNVGMCVDEIPQNSDDNNNDDDFYEGLKKETIVDEYEEEQQDDEYEYYYED